MITTGDRLAATAERLRREFDQSFARPPRSGEALGETLVTIQIREHPFALKLDEIGGLFADRAVTRLPSPFPDLLGLTGFRGSVVPVFDLGALLGYAPATAMRWLALSAGRNPVALAFERFERTLRVPAEELGNSETDGHVRQVARTAEGPRPIVHIPSILAVIDQRIRESG